jgi:molybdopterin adenylyltransferase
MNVKVAILTVSDRSSRGERPDTAGPALNQLITQQGWMCIDTKIVPDELQLIADQLVHWCDSNSVDIILTTGGTGFAPRDITPEATLAIIDKTVPGLAEKMRTESLKSTPFAMLSRSVCGIRKRTLIINLPGSPKGAVENLSYVLPVLPHAVELLQESPDAEAGHQNFAH